MGQFNYISHNVSTWTDSWSKIFRPTDIVIADPDNAWHPYPKLTSARYMFYPAERTGGYSPYINLGKVLKGNKNLRSILYVHDDMILTSSLLQILEGINGYQH